MVQANQQSVVWTMVVCTAILLVLGYIGVSAVMNSQVSADEIGASINIPAPIVNVDVPTAAEIAASVDIPENNNNDDLLEGVYPDKVNTLRGQCFGSLTDEYDEDDVLDELEALVEDMEGEEIVNLQILDWNYKDDYDFDINNLGLDDEEDKSGELSTTLQFSYELEDGNGDEIKDRAYLTASCDDFDNDDDEFDDVNFAVTL